MQTKWNDDRSPLEAWIVKNSSCLALGIIIAAFAMRLVYAGSCYLNPDEAILFDSARAASFLEAYRASWIHIHPPLFVLVLHGILFLGRTELILRLPSLLGGSAALWLTFAWLRRILGEIPSFAGLGFMALSSMAITASTECRQYGLFLFFISGALYATERTFTERSTIWAVIQGLFLLGAVLTHYAAVVVLCSLGLYVLLRSLLDIVPRRMLFTIVMSQLVLATVLCWLYFGHVRGAISFGPGASLEYLRSYYFVPQRETPLQFAWRALSGSFAYASGARRLALPFMLVFGAGLVALLTGRTRAPRLIGLLVISLFVVGFAAAIVQVFPFAGSRHQTYLLPFLAVGLSAALSWLPRRRAVQLLLLGAITVPPLWLIRAVPDNNPRVMPMGDMTATIKYIRQIVPRGAPLFIDAQTHFVLRYYLARSDASLAPLRSDSEAEEWLGGYRLVTPKVYAFDPNEALGQVAESSRALHVRTDDPLWLVSVVWFETPSLASRLPASGNHEAKEFGRISVVKVSNWEQTRNAPNTSGTQQSTDMFGETPVSANNRLP